MGDRRSAQRQRTYLAGRVAFYNRNLTIDCIVRNLSDSGAKLEFSSSVGVPGTFDVTIRHKGDSRRSRVIWRTDEAVGVAFDEGSAGTVVPIESARRLNALEAERVQLQRRIAQLSEPA